MTQEMRAFKLLIQQISFVIQDRHRKVEIRTILDFFPIQADRYTFLLPADPVDPFGCDQDALVIQLFFGADDQILDRPCLIIDQKVDNMTQEAIVS